MDIRTSTNNNKSKNLTTVDGTEYIIPKEGSLGLLALGYVGLIKWRQERDKSIEIGKKIETD